MTNSPAPKPFPVGEPLAGNAQADATAARAKRAEQAFPGLCAKLGKTGWTASRLGFGCYRVGWDNPEHARAMTLALAGGVNLIDTSANYTDGASEETVGVVVGQLAEQGELKRSEVVVVTKAGYIQGANMRVAVERQAAGRPFPEVVEYAEGCWHSIHPEFLADQIARSLARLQMESLDCLLLHNPEYFLSDAKNRGGVGESEREEFYRRVRLAFEHLETQVASGTIACYGISSNTFVSPAGDPEFVSLARCLEIAEEVAGGADSHHFRIAQMPGNLLERGFAEEPSQPGGLSPAEFAAEKGLALLLNRPLNAFGPSGGLTRLADPPKPLEEVSEADLVAAIDAMREREAEAHAFLAGDDPGKVEARRLLRHGSLLAGNWRAIHDREHWKQVVEQQLVPMAQYGLAALQAAQEAKQGSNGGSGDLPQRYLDALNEVMKSGFAWFAQAAQEQSATRRGLMLEALTPEEANLLAGASLSQIAVKALLAQAGSPVALMGMRHAGYVRDAFGCFQGPLAEAELAPDILGRAGQALERAEA